VKPKRHHAPESKSSGSSEGFGWSAIEVIFWACDSGIVELL
jgi:hypothetical protein